MKSIKSMSLKSLLVQALLGSNDHAEIMAEIASRNPSKAKPEVKAECDAALVRTQAARYGFEVTEEGRKFPSGLTIGLPEKPTAKQTAAFKAAKRMLSYYRAKLLKAKKEAPLTHSDEKKREASRTVKLLKSERDLESYINLLRSTYAAKS